APALPRGTDPATIQLVSSPAAADSRRGPMSDNPGDSLVLASPGTASPPARPGDGGDLAAADPFRNPLTLDPVTGPPPSRRAPPPLAGVQGSAAAAGGGTGGGGGGGGPGAAPADPNAGKPEVPAKEWGFGNAPQLPGGGSAPTTSPSPAVNASALARFGSAT